MSTLHAQKPFTVVIDPGHGGKDPGCVGSMAKEKTLNLAVSLKLGELIKKHHQDDVRIVYTRKTDVFIPLDRRAEIANKNKADLLISIHVNAVKKGNASGAETYVLGLGKLGENLEVAMNENSVILMEDDYMLTYEGFDPQSSESYIIFEFMQNKHLEQSIAFASEIQNGFVKADRADRSVRQAGFLVLRKTSMPAVLVELGFITNRDEERYLVTNKGQNELALAMFDAFNTYKNSVDRKLGNMNQHSEQAPLVLTAAAEEEIFPDDPPPTTQNLPTPQTKPEIDDVEPNDQPATQKPTTPQTKPREDTPPEALYKIQIMTSDHPLQPNDKRFKGYKDVSYYIENGLYKYTCGATADYKEILRLYRATLKDFKDAFIIKMRDGKRVND